jgi:hypothetical protein
VAETSKKTAGKVADGHRRVKRTYHRDLSLVGEVVDLPAYEAQRLVDEGRATFVDESTPTGKADPEQLEAERVAAGGLVANPGGKAYADTTSDGEGTGTTTVAAAPATATAGR